MNYTRPDATYPAIAESGGRATLSPAEVGAGWSTSSQTRPPADEFNARDFYSSAAMKYLCQVGVAEYSATEHYRGLGLCIGSNGSVYWNLIACIGIDPVNDATGHWEKTAIRRADCAELIGNVTGGSIPETTNVLMGNGNGSAADSGITTSGGWYVLPHPMRVQSIAHFDQNVQGSIPADAYTTEGLRIAWNMGNGEGETDFINYASTVGGGFAWFNVPGNTPIDSSTAYYMKLDSAGRLIMNGPNGKLMLYGTHGTGSPQPGFASIRGGGGVGNGDLCVSPGNTDSSIHFGLDSTPANRTGVFYFWSGPDGGGANNQPILSILRDGTTHAMGPLTARTLKAESYSAEDHTRANAMMYIGSDYNTPLIDLTRGSDHGFYRIGFYGDGLHLQNYTANIDPAGALCLLTNGGSLFVGAAIKALSFDNPDHSRANIMFGLASDYNSPNAQWTRGSDKWATRAVLYGDGLHFQTLDASDNLVYDNMVIRSTANAVSIPGALDVATLTISGTLTAGRFVLPSAVNPLEIWTDGGSTFIDGGAGGRLLLNLNRPGGVVAVAGALTASTLETSGTIRTPWWVVTAPAQRDVTGARAFGTWYQNTSGMSIQVTLTGVTTGGQVGNMIAYCGTSNGNSPAVWMHENTASVNNAEVGCAFCVPPGWFYAIVVGGNITRVGRWFEWDCP